MGSGTTGRVCDKLGRSFDLDDFTCIIILYI